MRKQNRKKSEKNERIKFPLGFISVHIFFYD
jgi:hypothetical protein